jgi:hypothetical protein
MQEFAWAVVTPEGRVLIDSGLDEAGAWIEAAMHGGSDNVLDAPDVASLRVAGYRVIRVRLFEVGPA